MTTCAENLAPASHQFEPSDLNYIGRDLVEVRLKSAAGESLTIAMTVGGAVALANMTVAMLNKSGAATLRDLNIF